MTLGSFFLTQKFINQAIETQGIVIKNQVCASNRNSPMAKPIVEFYTRNGERIELTSLDCVSLQVFKEGQEIKILYLENNPYKAKIAKNDSLYSPTFFFGMFSFIILFIAFFIVFSKGNTIVGLKAALIAGIFFIFLGFLFIFLGSKYWSNNLTLTLASIPVFIFGAFIIVRDH